MPIHRVFIWTLVIIPLLVLGYSFFQIGFSQISLSVDLDIKDKVLTISGETNLSGGTLIAYEITSNDSLEKEREGTLATGIAVVERRRYSVDVDTSLIGGRDVVVSVRFEIDPDGPQQPPGVIARYGRQGERISGGNVKQEGKRRWIEQRSVINLPP